jgi:hypothetical protein
MSKLSTSALFIILLAFLNVVLFAGLMASYANRGWLSFANAGDMAQIFEAIAVGLSLLFIATQLQQQTRLAKAANSQLLVNASSSFVLAIGSNSDLMKLYATGGRDFDTLKPEEKEQFRYLVGWWLTFFENVVYQYECDLLDKGVYDAWMKDMKGYIGRRSVEKVWDGLKDNYSKEFNDTFQPLIDERRRQLESAASSFIPLPQTSS